MPFAKPTNVIHTNRPARRRGTATVEFAFVAAFLGVLIVGMVEFGRAMTVKVTLLEAARKSCRLGIVPGKTNVDITTEATNVMRAEGFSVTKFNPPAVGAVNITVTDPNGATLADASLAPSDSKITVQVAVPVSSTMWCFAEFLPPGTIQSETVVLKKQ